jgi:predicted nucleic acid-binding Zn ribbon protein
MKRQNTQLLKDILQQVIRDRDMEPKLQEARILTYWDELTGAAVARATRNKYIRNRKLFVYLNSSIVRQQLFMVRDDLVEKLNRQEGASVIDELVLR